MLHISKEFLAYWSPEKWGKTDEEGGDESGELILVWSECGQSAFIYTGMLEMQAICRLF